MLELTGVEMVTPARHRLGERLPAEVEKARMRLVIESVFRQPQGTDAPRSPPGQDGRWAHPADRPPVVSDQTGLVPAKLSEAQIGHDQRGPARH